MSNEKSKEALLNLIADLSLAFAPPLVVGGLPLNEEDVESALEELGLLDNIATALRAVDEDKLASFASMEELRRTLTERGINTSAGLPPTDQTEQE
jgi:hypothetical protein